MLNAHILCVYINRLLGKPAPRGKKNGGQFGHAGTSLKAVEKPDHIEPHQVKACQYCSHSLKRRKAVGHTCAIPQARYETRQVFDIPKVQTQMTEHRAEIMQCVLLANLDLLGRTVSAKMDCVFERPAAENQKESGDCPREPAKRIEC